MFLRITATTGLSQMLYTPTGSPTPTRTFIANFNSAVVADANGTQLASGFVSIQAFPSTVEPFHLTMLGRLLQPYTGSFEFDVNGTYTSIGGVTTVLVDTIAGCNLRPS